MGFLLQMTTCAKFFNISSKPWYVSAKIFEGKITYQQLHKQHWSPCRRNAPLEKEFLLNFHTPFLLLGDQEKFPRQPLSSFFSEILQTANLKCYFSANLLASRLSISSP